MRFFKALKRNEVPHHLFPAEILHNFFPMLPILNVSLLWVAPLACLGVLLGGMSQILILKP